LLFNKEISSITH